MPAKSIVRPKERTSTPPKTAAASEKAKGRPSEPRARERLRVHDAFDRADLVDDDVAQRVEVAAFDLRDEVVLAKERVELDDLGHLQERIVDLVLLRGRGADEDEPDGHATAPFRSPRIKRGVRCRGRGRRRGRGFLSLTLPSSSSSPSS